MNSWHKHILGLLAAWAMCVSPCLAVGWMTIHTAVNGCEVVVDKEDVFPMKGGKITLSTTAGVHSLLITKDGYRPYMDTITIQDGVNQLLNIWLEPEDEKVVKLTTNFNRMAWDYQVENGFFKMRWFALGAGLGTGATMHASLFDMRIGLFSLEPCQWGFNAPFYENVSHVQTTWLVHPRDHRAPQYMYEMAIPSQGIQFFYIPMVGVHLPVFTNFAVLLSAGPQISWTRISWSEQTRDLPLLYGYSFTKEPFPSNGYHFDSVWFTCQIGGLFTGKTSDLLLYLRYQDGFFAGIEMRL
ncbi:MAG: PEGA domain-containing protein [Paludibacteraceae bacterium]|nr:PEGA domain-containing protein [Paludibacteraceae bacterium]